MADVMETHQNPALVTMQELGRYLETAKELKYLGGGSAGSTRCPAA